MIKGCVDGWEGCYFFFSSLPPSIPLDSLSLKSLGMLTSIMFPNGIKAACSISSVLFSSSPPEEEWREGGEGGERERGENG